jgi:hypothetical protein
VSTLLRCLGIGAWVALAGLAPGCAGDCCTVDSFPILLDRAPMAPGNAAAGGLLARASSDSLAGGTPFEMSVDTGSPLTLFSASADEGGQTMTRSFDLLDATPVAPLRARFRGITVLPVALGSVGDAATRPLAVFGGDLLRAFSVEFHFGVPSITFWANQQADDGFLEDVGYAVIHFTAYGGGEITADGNPDFLGLRGPLAVPATRIVFRTCAAPALFDPVTAPRELCCFRGDEVTNATGLPLSLMLSTGVGPLVLSRSAWTRLMPHLPSVPVETAGQLSIALSPAPIAVAFTTLPSAAHLALVNQEDSNATDPGPCVDLGRARRLEWVAYRQANSPADAVCAQPCDTDPNQTDEAQNSAAYIELGAAAGAELPIAIVEDSDPFLQGLRTDIRPEGPDIDGILGAGVLGRTRLEIDYRSSANRAIFSCDGADSRDVCWTGARCPRLPSADATHACFGLRLHGLPATCAPSGCQQ